MDPVFLPFDQFQDHPEPEWLVNGLLPKGYLAILASAPKAGKTCLATAIALAVATGKPFAELETQKAPVLWCCLEESRSERAVILKEVKYKKNDVPEFYTSTRPLRIDHPSGLDVLWDEILRKRPGLIVIDPLYAAIGNYSLGENRHARKALSTLKMLCGRENISALVLHHMTAIGKADNPTLRVAESAQLAATASMYMLFSSRRVPLDIRDHGSSSVSDSSAMASAHSESRTIKLECRGRGSEVNRDWYFKSRGPLDYQQSTGTVKKELSHRKAIVIKAMANDRVSIAEIVARTGLKLGSTRNLITEMVGEKLLYVSRIESGTRIFGVVSTLKK